MFKEVHAYSSNVVWKAIAFVVNHINKVLLFNMMRKKSVIVVCNLGLRNLILWSISLTLLRANDSSSWRLNCVKSFSCSAHFLFLLYRGCLSSGSNLSPSSSSPFRHPNSNFLTCLPDLVHRSAPLGSLLVRNQNTFDSRHELFEPWSEHGREIVCVGSLSHCPSCLGKQCVSRWR